MREFFIKEDCFKLSPVFQTAERIAVFASFAFFSIFSIIFLFSDAPSLPYLGALILLIVADQFFHYFLPRRSVRDMPPEGQVDLSDYISPKNEIVLMAIRGRSEEFGENFSLNLLMYAIGEGGMREALKRLDVSPDEFADKVAEKLKESMGREGDSGKDGEFLRILAAAGKEAIRSGESEITMADLFLASLSYGSSEARKIFKIFGIDEGGLRAALIFSRIGRKIPIYNVKKFADWFSPKSRRLFGGGIAARRVPVLSEFSLNMTKNALLGRAGFMVGHEEEYEELIRAMVRPENTAAVLIGEEGIGKDTIVEHFAYAITRDDIPKNIFDKQIYRLDISGFLSGDEEAVAKRVEAAFKEAHFAGNVIIYISGASSMVDLSRGRIISAAIESAAKSGRISFIMSDGEDQWEKIKRAGWFKNFKLINVNELSEDRTQEYLAYTGSVMEKKWGVTIRISALSRAVALAKKYSRGPLPASAETIISAALEEAKARDSDEVGPAEVMAGALRLSKNDKTEGI